ncbi:MAG: protease SohB [Gammaproteobacteria bacterium]
MLEILMQYGLFLAKAVTVVLALGALAAFVFGLSRKGRHAETLEVKNLNDRYSSMAEALKRNILAKGELKKFLKKQKTDDKARRKGKRETRARVFVLDFRGDIKASAVASLREEITALLTMASKDDEVVVRLENAGGLVHEHGLGASQLLRIKRRDIPLTVAVDKVAASGGYMMACVADRIIAAPFAVIGSVGVLAQVPNFHRLLDKYGVDFEQIKAGELKRTLTIFGQNTEEDRENLKIQIEDTHTLFKDFVAEQRPALDIARISTGEHWYGKRALELQLVDEISTSDDYLLERSEERDVYTLEYAATRRISERLAAAVHAVSDKLYFGWWKRANDRRLFD